MPSIKSVFPKPLKGIYVGKGQWKLEAPFHYINLPIIIKVPKGFCSDGASIPKFAFSIIGAPWRGKYSRGAVIHDYEYFSQTRTRREADQIFYDAMIILKVPWWKRRIMHLCVRMAGWIPWKNRRKKLPKSPKDYS
jgi:hypothetical protein